MIFVILGPAVLILAYVVIMMEDERYLMLPSHVRVVTGANFEEKCNLVVSEEAGYGYHLFASSVSSYDSSDSYPSVTIILCFYRVEKLQTKQEILNELAV